MNANLSITKGIKKEKVKVIFLEDTVRKAKGKRMYHRDKKKKKQWQPQIIAEIQW